MEVDDGTAQVTDYHSSNEHITTNQPIIESIDVSNYPIKKEKRNSNAYDKSLCKDNKPLMEFINKCILLDTTMGMEAVIKKVLLPAYVRADTEYKRSERFEKVVTKALQRLINNPEKKYTHISDIVDTLKFHVATAPTPESVSTQPELINNLTSPKPHVSTSSKPSNVLTSPKPHVSTSHKPHVSTSPKASNILTYPKPYVSTSPKPSNVLTSPKPHVSTSHKPSNVLTSPKPHVSTSPKPSNVSTSPKPVNVLTSPKAINVSTSPKPRNVLTSPQSSVSTSPTLNAPPVRKRVNLITLSTKVSVKPNEFGRKRPIVDISEVVSPKKSKPEVVVCDDDDEVISVDDNINEDDNLNNEVTGNFRYNDEVDNLVNETIEIQDSQELEIIDDAQSEQKENEQLTHKSNDESANEHDNKQINNEADNEKENLGSNEDMNDLNKLLVPHKEKVVTLEKPKKIKQPKKMPEEMTEDEKARRINEIEAKIEKCNRTIAKLDLEEVTDDSANSPYYKCDRLRATIVKLYKELCTLVGEETPERPKFRLQVKEGAPEGPIKRLEKFLNEQTDEDGEPLFPDFRDVLSCVERANVKDKLGWSKEKVKMEAEAIFKYTGHYLQKRRQKREFNHVLATVGRENYEADPAERDQELQARLEANRRISRQKMAEVIGKFTIMQDNSKPEESTSFNILEDKNSSSNVAGPTENSTAKEINNLQHLSIQENNNTDNSVKNDTINNNSDSNTIVNKCSDINSSVTAVSIQETNNTDNSVKNDTIKNNSDSNTVVNICSDINSCETAIVKQEPEELMKTHYQGDISLVIEISDSESEDECEVLAV